MYIFVCALSYCKKNETQVVYWNPHLIFNFVKISHRPEPCGPCSIDICLDRSSQLQTIWSAEVSGLLELGQLSHCKGAGVPSTRLLQATHNSNIFNVVT